MQGSQMQASQQKHRNKHKCCDRDERIQDLHCAISKNRAFAHISSKILEPVWNWLHILARHIFPRWRRLGQAPAIRAAPLAPLADLQFASPAITVRLSPECGFAFANAQIQAQGRRHR
jgi:hypothetical protein